MCGRAKLPNDYSEIKVKLRFSELAPAPNWRPSWNIAPTQDMFAAIHEPALGRAPRICRWGLIPPWSKDDKPKYATFNARAETVETLATFRGAWRAGRRCLIITDGFYEWRKADKQPFAISRADGDLTVMAGLWEAWRSPASGETIQSCTVITTTANRAMAELHDRMPVVLAEKDWPVWLGEEPAQLDHMRSLMCPCPDEDLRLYAVDPRIGNPRNNAPEYALPI